MNTFSFLSERHEYYLIPITKIKQSHTYIYIKVDDTRQEKRKRNEKVNQEKGKAKLSSYGKMLKVRLSVNCQFATAMNMLVLVQDATYLPLLISQL